MEQSLHKHQPIKQNHQDLLIYILLALLVVGIFWQTHDFQYVVFDDPGYVSENHRVLRGLTVENIKWSFTTFDRSNWHPITWLSYLFDVHLFGANPGPQHVENLLFHLANSLILFFFFSKVTGYRWESAFVAALFATHPLHVESVAWISERKDVLSTFFFLLALCAYAKYAEKPGFKSYGLVFLSFTLGLMTKPMLVTFPFILLLMDYWPLKRIDFLGLHEVKRHNLAVLLALLYEKIPLFILSSVSCVITYLAQSENAVINSIEVTIRAKNALFAYLIYLIKMVYPVDLAVFYPYPTAIAQWKIMVAISVLIALMVAAISNIRKSPWMTIGLLWYFGTLVPVIGIIQVGRQAMADRYTYIPSIGIFIIIAWSFKALIDRYHVNIKCAAISGLILIAILSTLSIKQTGVWKNSFSLFLHALSVTTDNDVAHHNLGFAYKRVGDLDKSVAHYTKATEINPNFASSWSNIGVYWADKKQFDKAINYYRKALQLEPDIVEYLNNMATAYLSKGDIDKSITIYRKALQIDPNHYSTHNLLGLVFLQKGRLTDAHQHLSMAYQMNPQSSAIRNNFLLVSKLNQQTSAAFKKLISALESIDDNNDLQNKADLILTRKRSLCEVIMSYRKAISLQPGFHPSNVIISELIDIENLNQAYIVLLPMIVSSIQQHPVNFNISYHMACIYAIQNKDDMAAKWLHTSLSNGLNDLEILKIDFHLDRIVNTSKFKHILVPFLKTDT